MSQEIITATMAENYSVTLNSSAGYTGEHNAKILQILLNSEFALDTYDYLTLRFDLGVTGRPMCSNRIVDTDSSPVYRAGSIIYCPLSSALTCTGTLTVQVLAHRTEENGRVLRMSEPFTLYFRPSVRGGRLLKEDTLFDIEQKINEFIENGGNPAEPYILPEATSETLGGIKTGKYLKNENGVVSVDCKAIKYLTPMVVCTLMTDDRLSDIVIENPADITYIDAEHPGELSEKLAQLCYPQVRLLFVPTEDGQDISYINFTTDEVEHFSCTEGNVYMFEYDPDEYELRRTVLYSYNFPAYMNNHSHTAQQVTGLPLFVSANIPVYAWSQNRASVRVTGLGGAVIIQPAPDSAAQWKSCGVEVESAASGFVNFTCTSTPAAALKFSILAERGA